MRDETTKGAVPPIEPLPVVAPAPVAPVPPVEATPPVASPVPHVDPYAATQPNYGPTPTAYPPAGYANPQAGYYAPQQAQGPVGLSIASMVLGICGVIFGFTSGLGLFPAIAAVITGHLGYARQPRGKGYGLTGLITGYVGILISLVVIGFVVLFVVVAIQHPDTFSDSGD